MSHLPTYIILISYLRGGHGVIDMQVVQNVQGAQDVHGVQLLQGAQVGQIHWLIGFIRREFRLSDKCDFRGTCCNDFIPDVRLSSTWWEHFLGRGSVQRFLSDFIGAGRALPCALRSTQLILHGYVRASARLAAHCWHIAWDRAFIKQHVYRPWGISRTSYVSSFSDLIRGRS